MGDDVRDRMLKCKRMRSNENGRLLTDACHIDGETKTYLFI